MARKSKHQFPYWLFSIGEEGQAENDNLAVGAHGGSNEQDELKRGRPWAPSREINAFR